LLPPSTHKRGERGVRLQGEVAKEKTQTKTKSKITRGCNNGEKVCSPEEELDDDHYYFHFLHIKEERGEQDHRGEHQKPKMQTKTRNKSRRVCSDGKKVFFT
jgi:hypothetical protein